MLPPRVLLVLFLIWMTMKILLNGSIKIDCVSICLYLLTHCAFMALPLSNIPLLVEYG